MTKFKDSSARQGVLKAAQVLRPRLVRSGRVYAEAWEVLEAYLNASMPLLDEMPLDAIDSRPDPVLRFVLTKR